MKIIDYAWPGGYPVVYLTGSDETLCPDCARAEDDPTDLTPHTHFEGEPVICDECSAKIESAYGVPE